jgi:hypothetical protein
MPTVRTNVAITKANSFAGVALPFVTIDPANGMQVNDTGKVLLVVESTGTATCDVQLTSRVDLNNRLGDIAATINAGDVRVLGPFPDSSIWGDGTNLFVDFYLAGTGGTTKTPLTGQTLAQLKIAAVQA